MELMKRWLPLLLALALLPAAALAADMDIPQIDPAAAGIAARPIANADEALYRSKNAGRDRTTIHC